MRSTLLPLVLVLALNSCQVNRALECRAEVTEETAMAFCREKQILKPRVPEGPIEPASEIAGSLLDNLESR